MGGFAGAGVVVVVVVFGSRNLVAAAATSAVVGWVRVLQRRLGGEDAPHSGGGDGGCSTRR